MGNLLAISPLETHKMSEQSETEEHTTVSKSAVYPLVMRAGTWPEECRQRAFVDGAAWWQSHANGATMFPSERDEEEKEAVRRYGEPA